MNRIEMIWYSLLIIGGTLLFVSNLAYALICMIEKNKKEMQSNGFSALIFFALLVFVILIPSIDVAVSLVWIILGLSSLYRLIIKILDIRE